MRPLALVIVVASACAPVSLPQPQSRVVDYDAGAGETVCAPAGSRVIGEHCRCAADCADPTSTCLTEEIAFFPQGMCATNCINGKACEAGQHCQDTVCYLTCDTTADCPPETFCALGECTPFCQRDSDCLSGNCNAYIGHCLAAGVVPPGGGLDATCANNTDCKSDLCQDGHCSTPCSVSTGLCPENGVCISIEGDLGRCFAACTVPQTCPTSDRRCASIVPGMPTACLPTTHTGCFGATSSPTAGHACGCNDDCDPGTLCLDEANGGYPHGVCAIICNTNADCPATTSCFDALCLPKCTTEVTCEFARLCGLGICGPYCVTNEECLDGQCNRYAGLCEATPATGGGVGDKCAKNADCKSGFCNTDAQPDGICVTYCSTQRGVCPDDTLCIPYPIGSTSGFCARQCTTPADCPQQHATCVAQAAGLPKYCD